LIDVMCGRYTIKDPVALAKQIAHLTGEPFEIVAARYNITPSQLNPVVRPRKSAKPAASFMRWGFAAAGGRGRPGSLHANARSEDVFSRPTFSVAVQERRCAVAADGFYEWRVASDNRRLPHHFCLKSNAPFFFAGIFQDGSEAMPPTYALLTTGPNALMRPVHDRMPVMLNATTLPRWLDPAPLSAGEVRGICEPFDPDLMAEWPVSIRVNSPKHDDPACVVPTPEPPPDQGELFG
jgi:putative SOS response-associated peptidase YedK